MSIRTPRPSPVLALGYESDPESALIPPLNPILIHPLTHLITEFDGTELVPARHPLLYGEKENYQKVIHSFMARRSDQGVGIYLIILP